MTAILGCGTCVLSHKLQRECRGPDGVKTSRRWALSRQERYTQATIDRPSDTRDALSATLLSLLGRLDAECVLAESGLTFVADMPTNTMYVNLGLYPRTAD